MTKKPIVIVWLRQDLRLQDNPALVFACDIGQILPIYILDDTSKDWSIGSAQKWWLQHSLTNLKKDFAKHKIELIFRRGDPEKILNDLIKETKSEHIVWNRCYDPQSIKRDTHLKQLFIDQNIEAKSFNASLLLEPGLVKNKSGSYFKVFTPYWKECLRRLDTISVSIIPKMSSIDHPVQSDNLNDWNLLPKKPNWASKFKDHWEPGEKGARKALSLFIDNAIDKYKVDRNIPGKVGTSKLSPYLHFGEISIKYVWQQVKQLSDKDNSSHLYTFLSELGWREFSYYLLYHYNELPATAFNPKFKDFEWKHNQSQLESWQKGNTGYPIVDAGMRQLWQTGWMHNRVRMIVASFLTKHLLINWQYGADWFLDTLVDADIASNSAGWQWVAGCGADAAPYFRIFNPILQGQKFDEQGKYIRKYVPELALLPDKFIHTPWLAGDDILKKCNIILGKNYPRPIVDHTKARNEALNAYHSLKKSE